MLQFLKNQGLRNPHRVKRLIYEAVSSLELDLEGLVILTEAASNNYVVTPILAAIAGAKTVYAVTADSRYGKAKDVAEFTHAFAEFCQVREVIEVVFNKSWEVVSQADIITNLGFVRPINADLVRMMKRDAVISLMCEAWEVRREDIDLDACRKKRIPVVAINEDYPGLAVFNYSGHLCMKMLFDMEIEVYRNKIAVISNDKFGTVVAKYLCTAGAETRIFSTLKDEECLRFLADADAMIIASYTSDELFIGSDGQINVTKLKDIAPGITVIQFAGRSEVSRFANAGIPCFPPHEIGAQKMGMTFAYLGPKPVIELHTAGLKVGELVIRQRHLEKKRLENEALPHGRWKDLAVPLIPD